MAIVHRTRNARSWRSLPLIVLVGACGGEPAPHPTEGAPPPTRQAPVEAVVTTEDDFATAPTVPAPDAGTPVATPETGDPPTADGSAIETTSPAAAPPASGAVPAAAPSTPSDSASPAGAAATAVAAAPAVEAPAASSHHPTTYVLDPSQGSLTVQVYKDPDTVAAGMSHDHIVAATGWSGTVTWDPDDPGACKVHIDVPVKGLTADTDGLRKRAGLEPMLSDSQRDTVRKNMLAKDQLAGDQFPTISFRSQSCTAGSGGVTTVTGLMTVRGASKTIAAKMTIVASDATFTAKGRFSARHSAFGFDPYSAMMGGLKNRDAMDFAIDVKGSPVR